MREMKFVRNWFRMCGRALCPEILGVRMRPRQSHFSRGVTFSASPNVNDAGQQSMWNSIQRTALVIGLLTATAAFAHAQSSDRGHCRGQ